MNSDGLRPEPPNWRARAWNLSRGWWLVGAAVVTLGLAAVFGRPHVSRWQQRRLIAAAEKALAGGDLRSAILSAREALRKNPASAPACALLAQIAERENSPEAVLWRQRLAEMDPQRSNLLDLATTATNFGDAIIAEHALSQIPEIERETAAFHATAAAVATAQKQWSRAAKEFQRAIALDPKDENLRLNLAILQLAVAAPDGTAEAVATLERFRQKPPFRHAALRALLTDARRRGDAAEARKILEELQQGADASLGDRLLLLEEIQHAQSPEFGGELSALQTLAAKNGGTIFALLKWMNAHGLAAQSLEWCDALPAKLRAQLPVPLAEAEARTALGDWKKLREIVRDSDWGDLEFLRLAIHARVLFETGGQTRRSEFRPMWESAMNATRGNPDALVMLGRLVNGWGWKAEATEVWWLAAKSGTGGRAALKALFENYSAGKNTRELYRVARRVFEMEPANPVAKNNVASLALLLGEDGPEAHRLAAENYRLTPTQPVLAATYAFSLHRQKRTGEAVAILKKLPPPALADPSIAACYGFLLAQNGETGAARPFLEAADREKEKLFPEEAAMVAEALQRRP